MSGREPGRGCWVVEVLELVRPLDEDEVEAEEVFGLVRPLDDEETDVFGLVRPLDEEEIVDCMYEGIVNSSEEVWYGMERRERLEEEKRREREESDSGPFKLAAPQTSRRKELGGYSSHVMTFKGKGGRHSRPRTPELLIAMEDLRPPNWQPNHQVEYRRSVWSIPNDSRGLVGCIARVNIRGVT